MWRSFPRSLALFCLVVLMPAFARAQSPSLAQLLASGDEAWRSGRHEEAFSRYSAVLREDSTAARAVFRVATLLAWRNDLDRSISLFRLYVRLAPDDDDGRVGLARALAWRGRYDQSVALCDSIVARNPSQRDAALLGAQVLAWSGQLDDAIARYQHWLSAHNEDAEAWVALAQAWRWAGRADETRRAVQHALNIDARNTQGREHLEWATVALSPSVEPTITNTNDSDDNRSTTYAVRAGFAAPWNARVLADASYRVADLAARHGTATTLRASSSWSPINGRWTLRGELGATQLDATDGLAADHVTHIQPLAWLRLSGRPMPALSLGAGASHTAFDETAALIFSGIATSTLDGDIDVAIRPRLNLGGGGGWTTLRGGSSPNTRVGGSSVLRWSLARYLSLAGTVRGFSYEHAAFDGYFAPKRYLLAELSSRVWLGGELGWSVESELGLGNQTITAFDNSSVSRFAQRANAGLVYRPAAGVEWGLTGGFANVASPATISSADYHAYTIAIKGRWRL
jgi:tetratricopeptide (TPR) repeat protein